MSESAPTGRSRLTAERTREVYASVLALLTEVGYDNLRMDAIAARASASKATLYRQWGTKVHLVIEAIASSKPDPDITFKDFDTGSLRGDWHAWAKHVTSVKTPEAGLMLAILSACKNSRDLRDALKARFFEDHQDSMQIVFDRAIERGELAADSPTIKYVPVMLATALVFSEIFDDGPLTADVLIDYLDATVLAALGVPAEQ